jgi:hypothetical protein
MAHLTVVGFAVPRVHDANGADLVIDHLRRGHAAVA